MAGSDTEALKAEQDNLISLPFSDAGGDIVDIVNNYCWRLDEATTQSTTEPKNDGEPSGQDSAPANNSSTSDLIRKDNTPFCLVVERQSAINASIANIANMIAALGGQLEDAAGGARNAAGAIGLDTTEGSTTDTVLDGVEKGIESIKSVISDLTSKFKFDTLLNSSNLAHNRFFTPYKYLYITNPTGKKFVFPLVTKDSSFGQIKNSWQAAKSLPGALGEMIDSGANLLKTGAVLLNLGQNFTAVADGKNRDEGNIVDEVPKTYSYPKDGESLTVNFTLYNTSKLNAWKDNYRFLLLFVLRNLPMRIDAFSFLPPMLYEVIQPGIKTLPICTAETIKINPLGMTRVLKCPNFINNAKELSVNVPEAWDVSITFKSLIPTSANMYLAHLGGISNVSASTSGDAPPSASEQAASTPAAAPEST